ncbi:DUF6415 family natural product biosynthesis protein [Streptomyces sp. CBMA152]|uniref:DUF6415 family natural product biosynthesis protein n=1 Tax=Streptomyces sp. CBMA152 TaxID=1896312 RepID=UPI0037DA4A61
MARGWPGDAPDGPRVRHRPHLRGDHSRRSPERRLGHRRRVPRPRHGRARHPRRLRHQRLVLHPRGRRQLCPVRQPDVTLLTPETTWLGIPELHRTAKPGAYWPIPPRRREDYCIPAGVDEVIRLGRRRAAESTVGAPAGPCLDAIAEECEALLADAPAHADALSLEDATAATMRYRGHLGALLPAVQDAATGLHFADPARSRLLLGITEAHRQLALDSESSNLPQQWEHARRLARCCLAQVKTLRARLDRRAWGLDLDGPAPPP